MSDQHKPAYKSGLQPAYDVDYRPVIPNGTIEMWNKKFKEWEIRRGLVTKTPFGGGLRGMALRKSKNVSEKPPAVVKKKKTTTTKKKSTVKKKTKAN